MSWTLADNPVGDLDYSYDADGRVIEKTGSFAQTGLPQAVTGNMFNAANEMTAFNGTPQTYDANGNVANDGRSTYDWDARNHLTAIAGPNAASFAYDADGRRAQKTIDGTSTQFLYDGSIERRSSRVVLRGANMLTGLDIDEYFQRSDNYRRVRCICQTSWAAPPHLPTRREASRPNIYTISLATALPAGLASSNPYQFTGGENDATGLEYDRARYYSPGMERFISQDPLEFDGGTRIFILMSAMTSSRLLTH